MVKLGTCAKKCKGKRKTRFRKCVKRCMRGVKHRHRHRRTKRTYYTYHKGR